MEDKSELLGHGLIELELYLEEISEINLPVSPILWKNALIMLPLLYLIAQMLNKLLLLVTKNALETTLITLMTNIKLLHHMDSVLLMTSNKI
jgi:hypothetical protein